jgi:flavodoxin
MSKTLVAYFSATGITKAVAKDIAEIVKGDIYEIKPEVPYTNADLNWMDKSSRSTVEMDDKSSRPAIVNDNAKIENYDTIYLGFPIWWYVAPTIVNTFLEKYDFSNKKIILFATSGGSGFGGTIEYLKKSVSDTTEFIEGKLLNYSPSKEEIKEWIDSLPVKV